MELGEGRLQPGQVGPQAQIPCARAFDVRQDVWR